MDLTLNATCFESATQILLNKWKSEKAPAVCFRRYGSNMVYHVQSIDASPIFTFSLCIIFLEDWKLAPGSGHNFPQEEITQILQRYAETGDVSDVEKSYQHILDSGQGLDWGGYITANQIKHINQAIWRLQWFMLDGGQSDIPSHSTMLLCDLKV